MYVLSTLRLLLLTALLAVSGCKLAVIVGEGGIVRSSGSGTCLSGKICSHNITDTTYTESFTAVPNTGWHFLKWKSGGGFVCADNSSTTCVVSNIPFAGNPGAEAFIASDEYLYLMPVFTDELPITDTVMALGKEWAQPDLFLYLSWNTINSVCPVSAGGECTGTLKGYDMNGWTWATLEDVNALFNHYIGSEELGPGPATFIDTPFTFSSAFFADGWRPTRTTPDEANTSGLLGTVATPGVEGRSGSIGYSLASIFTIDIAITTGTPAVNDTYATTGGYFYRHP